MAKAYVFPGQGAQKPRMGKDLYESDARAKEHWLNVGGKLVIGGREAEYVALSRIASLG